MRRACRQCWRFGRPPWRPLIESSVALGVLPVFSYYTGQRPHLPSLRAQPWLRSYATERVHHGETESDKPTIFALSTAPGRAAIAVVRISGPACRSIYHALCPGRKLPRPRYATVRSLHAPHTPTSPDSVLDSNALVLYFPAPNTVTGEDVLELHVHGGPAIVRAVLTAISNCSPSDRREATIRYAEPGEFTRRAFLNERLDLTQVEALGDTLSATTEQQRRASVRGTRNKLSCSYEEWRKALLLARGELEALIDFSEDQHFDESPSQLTQSVADQVRHLIRTLQAHSQNAVKGELLRNGIGIGLLGAPNAGKSSLLNRVVGREAAIVSQEAGTTRDVVEVGLDLGGYLCKLGDTAGLRKAQEMSDASPAAGGPGGSIGQIEREGMRRAKERAQESDVVIVVLSFERQDRNGETRLNLDSEVIETAGTLARERGNVIVVVNKMDQKPATYTQQHVVKAVQAAIPSIDPLSIHCISCKDAESSPANVNTGSGGIQPFLSGLICKFDELTRAIVAESGDLATPEADMSVWQESLGATERHRLLLDECIGHLHDFLTQVGSSHAPAEHQQQTDVDSGDGDHFDIVLAAESLRGAATCLARITGRGEGGDVEEVLGVVFEKFCVGK